jgi:methionyl-tRNA formyltransferase
MAVVLHRMDSELDAGPVLARRQMTLTAMTYVADIYSFLAVAVPELFVRVLAEIDAGEAVAVAQPEDPTIALRGFPRLPSDSEIDWAETADHIAAIVRASGDPYCGAFTYWNGARLTVRRARADDLPYPWMGTPGQVAEVRPQSGEVVVLCGRGVLVLEQVQYDGPARRPAADVIRSGRARLGVDVSEDLASLRRRVADLERRLRERESAHDEEDGECKA